MASKSYIDIQVVGLMCHVLNGEEDKRYEKLMYCIPPEILQRMFQAHHQNWMDKKKRRPHEISSLRNHDEYLHYLDREKLVSHRFLFAPVLYSEHWWLYVLDKSVPEMFVLDSKNISSPTDERTTQNKFAEKDRHKDNHEQGEFIESRCNNNTTKYGVTRPGAALRSPYIQISIPDLPTK
ncbi:hypothetical protein PIB30_038833 [Stylosanthes scabra]|uniref:Ubiquitin-like protease family profile domain-containing protein n=1 Tax=Stylosanthes scabra TaxID=79078 RepID=A0ABU6TDT4_9FABA|nr:hypothetical protein [Stylosanthes scabra]